MLALFWGLWIASAIVRGLQWPQLWPMRLPVFKAFLVVILVEDVAFMWRLSHGIRNQPIQEAIFPYMVAFKFAVAAEAAWWLASSLPKFRRIAIVWMLISFASGWLVSTWSAPKSASWLQHAEVTSGIGLAVFVGLTIAIHAAIGTEANSALWHASLFAVYVVSVGAGWFLQSKPVYGAFSMWGLQIGAAALWVARVKTPPTWVPPEPIGTRADVDEAITQMRVALPKKPPIW